MPDLFHVLLFFHVLGAIVAFGPGFAAMVVGPMVAKEPQHANFYARTQVLAARRLITPVSISMLVTGVAMILVRGWDAISGGTYWLDLGIGLYVVAFVVAMAIQAPAGRRLVELTSTPRAPGTPLDPAIPATARRLKLGGAALSLLTVAIVFTMAMNPA